MESSAEIDELMMADVIEVALWLASGHEAQSAMTDEQNERLREVAERCKQRFIHDSYVMTGNRGSINILATGSKYGS